MWIDPILVVSTLEQIGIRTDIKHRLLTKIDFNVMHLVNMCKKNWRKLQIQSEFGLSSDSSNIVITYLPWRRLENLWKMNKLVPYWAYYNIGVVGFTKCQINLHTVKLEFSLKASSYQLWIVWIQKSILSQKFSQIV